MSDFDPFEDARAEPDNETRIELERQIEEEAPPEPPFLVVRNAFGPGAHSVKLPDGTPVGVYVRENNMAPSDVEEWLTELGMDEDLIDFFVRNRRGGIEADKKLYSQKAQAALIELEAERNERLDPIRKAFIEQYKKKMGK